MEYSLRVVVETTTTLNKASAGYTGSAIVGARELSSLSSELEGKLYHASSLSLLCSSEYSLSDESGGEESSN